MQALGVEKRSWSAQLIITALTLTVSMLLLFLLPALATPGWSTPANISPVSTNNSYPRIAVDSVGNPHVVWTGNDGSTDQVYYATKTGGVWSSSVILSTTSTDNVSAV